MATRASDYFLSCTYFLKDILTSISDPNGISFLLWDQKEGHYDRPSQPSGRAITIGQLQ